MRVKIRGMHECERYQLREICGIVGLILLGVAAIVLAAGFGG